MTPLNRKYVRSVTFLDREPDDGKQLPVHVAHELLLDNEPTAARVNLALGFSIYGASQEGTVVTFCVHPEDVTIAEIDASGEVVQWPAIVGRDVVVPKSSHWETVHARDSREEVGDWVRVYLFVREAKVLPAPRIGNMDDRITALHSLIGCSSPVSVGPNGGRGGISIPRSSGSPGSVLTTGAASPYPRWGA